MLFRLAIFVERDANAEIFAQNMVGIDDEGVAAALAANASASADYERAKAVNASAHAAVEAALAIADSGTATQVSASGSEATYGCSIPAGAGGVYAVVAAADYQPPLSNCWSKFQPLFCVLFRAVSSRHLQILPWPWQDFASPRLTRLSAVFATLSGVPTY